MSERVKALKAKLETITNPAKRAAIEEAIRFEEGQLKVEAAPVKNEGKGKKEEVK